MTHKSISANDQKEQDKLVISLQKRVGAIVSNTLRNAEVQSVVAKLILKTLAPFGETMEPIGGPLVAHAMKSQEPKAL